MEELNAGDLRGREVIDSRGNVLGEVKDVTLDPAKWRVTGLRVGLKRDVADKLRVERPLVGSADLSLAVERVKNIGDTVMLNVDTTQIGELLNHKGP